jgi:hypothetical protein
MWNKLLTRPTWRLLSWQGRAGISETDADTGSSRLAVTGVLRVLQFLSDSYFFGGVCLAAIPSVQHMSYFVKHTSGDARRPQEVRQFDRAEVNTDDQSPDALLLVAVVLGMLSLLVKAKLAAWPAVICVASAVANTPHETVDYKHMISTITFAVMGLIASYVTPTRLPAPS